MPQPPPTFPAADANGVAMLGGELSPDWMLAAYRQGVFPWPIVLDDREHLAWFAPHRRAILPLDRFRLSRRTRRRLRSGVYTNRRNTAFQDVVQQCAERSSDEGVWLTESLAEGYLRLHDLGHAHSFEAWSGDRLVGGVLGVSLGGLFSAESMFHRAADGGNAALAYMVDTLRVHGFLLVDIQQMSPHMLACGAVEISSREYKRRLAEALAAGERGLGTG